MVPTGGAQDWARDMGQELVIVPAGLYTDPSPHGAAPPGALRTATNVVIRRAGSVEPRPGFVQAQVRPDVNLQRVHAILAYPGVSKVLYVGAPQATDTTFINGAAVTTDAGGALPWTRGYIQAAAIRKNLYLSTADSVRKITSETATTASKIGTPPCLLVVSGPGGSPGSAVPAGQAVSYRAVVVRKDPNGLIVRSAPSNRVIFKNVSGATVDPNVQFTLHSQDDNSGLDTVELYRSLAVPVAGLPFDEHFFAKSFVSVFGNLAFGGRDNVAELDLGAPLYTNEDEEGAANANIRPPQAKDVHEFNGSLFLANLTYPAQMAISFTWTPNLLATDVNGVGQRILTGTYTNGSAVVTGVASTVGFRVGQIIDDGLNEWAGTVDLPRIISLTGTSVTFSANYTGTTGSKSKAVHDSVRVNNQYFPVGAASWISCVQSFWDSLIFGAHTPSTSVYALTDDIVTSLSSGLMQDPNNRSLLLKAINATSSPFVVYATHGSEYTPSLPEPTVTGKVADQDVFPSGVAWSKTFEPEHFSLVDMELIGGDRADTWRIVKGRDALWVMKVDGLWRLTGAGRDAGFRIDPVSKAKLLTPNCVANIFDQVYIWTDQGILGLDSGANAVQSQPIRDQLIDVQQATPLVTNYDIWLCGNQKSHELILSLPDSFGGSRYLLVYNFLNNAWTRWDLHKRPSCAGHPLNLLEFGIQNVVLAEGGATYVTTREDEPLHDSKYTANVTAVVGLAVTIATGSGWDPSPGDALDFGAFLVDVVTDPTHFTVRQPGLTSGPKQALVAYQCEIEPVACTTKNPSILKLWQEGSMLWGDLRYIQNYTLSFTSSLDQVPVTCPKVVTTPGQASCSHRFIVPRAHARTEQLFPKVIVRNAYPAAPGDIWNWQGLSLFYSAMGPRVRAK